MQTIITIIICVILLFLTYSVYAFTYWKRRGVPNDVTSFYKRFARPFHIADYEGFLKYGKIVGIYEVMKPVLVVGDPILARNVMVNQFFCFPNHRFNGDIINSIGGKMLFTLPYESWKRVRAIVSPSFSTIKMKSLIPTIHSAITTFIENVTKKAANNEIIDMKTYLCSLTLDVIGSCSFGVKVQSLSDPNNNVVYNSNRLFGTNISWFSLLAFNCPSLAPIGTRLGISILDFSALKFFQRLILEMIQKRLETNSTRKDFIQLLMDAEIKDDELNGNECKRSELLKNKY
ncbi:cytochrome P450 monooxygenase-like protein [Leptotrombidium deliense]|uniref:Cytochrome P450 monooxygenase-like protein n=1 Tax=Leptotrombidium deliense TaxID=299467 RepID=A0A443SLY9_9ACAR|nr:cytochrome P450 monooxygenase-like protein [Leptotrombidium deliense]